MKSFLEYKEHLNQHLLHLVINNDQDLLNFTRFLLNYGQVAQVYFEQEVAQIAQNLKLYGFTETELLEPIRQVQFKDQTVYLKTLDNKVFSFPLKSVVEELKTKNSEMLDLLILLSVSLNNETQALFQVVHFASTRKTKPLTKPKM